MATSSIFHNVRISAPEQAEAFVAALEAARKESLAERTQHERYRVNEDMNLSRKLQAMRYDNSLCRS